MQHHIYIQVPKAIWIWKTWIWLSFLLECLMAWNICTDFTCRATNWDHFPKVFFGISEASVTSTCRTMVWRNCPAESRRETMRIWYFLNSGSFRGLCPLVFQWRFEPGFIGFQRWVYFGRLESRFFEKFGGTLGGAGVMTERFASGEVEGCGGMGWEKVLEGSEAILEGSGSVLNVTGISQSVAKSSGKRFRWK